MYSAGNNQAGITVSVEKAADLFRQACDGGSGYGCENLAGEMTRVYGDEISFDSPIIIDIFPYLDKACNLGRAFSCVEAGKIIMSGFNIKETGSKRDIAAKRFERGCDLLKASSCLLLAKIYVDETSPEALDYTKAREFYFKACNLADRDACSLLGEMYAAGHGGELDLNKAADLYLMSCDMNDGDGCTFLGRMHEMGKGSGINYERARDFYLKGCELKDGNGCRFLSNLQLQGTGDKFGAIESLALGCEYSDLKSCSELPKLLRSNDLDNSQKTFAFDKINNLCQSDNQELCAWVALFYEQGLSVEQDIKKAIKMYEVGCESAYSWSCDKLGYIYLTGKIVETDIDQSVYYYEKACNLKRSQSCVMLGYQYYIGTTLPKNPEKSQYFQKAACDLQDWTGCANLAYDYLYGFGVDKDPAIAKKYAEISCEKNTGYGCFILGEFYRDFEEDPQRAYKLFDESCQQGLRQGCDALVDSIK